MSMPSAENKSVLEELDKAHEAQWHRAVRARFHTQAPAIRSRHAAGMSRKRLVEIYGADIVAMALGDGR